MQAFNVWFEKSRRGLNSTKSMDTIFPVDRILATRYSASSTVSPFGSGTPVPGA